jgi:hypothetical protein
MVVVQIIMRKHILRIITHAIVKGR